MLPPRVSLLKEDSLMPTTFILLVVTLVAGSLVLSYAMGRRRSLSELLFGGAIGFGLLLLAGMIARS